jgi:hypothetical protein
VQEGGSLLQEGISRHYRRNKAVVSASARYRDERTNYRKDKTNSELQLNSSRRPGRGDAPAEY